MIEKIIYDYLTDVLSVPVSLEVPKDPPPSYVVMEKTGSGRQDLITSATILFRSYAPTLYEAALLNETVKEALDASIILDDVTKAKLNSDYNYTDTSKKLYRYQCVYDFTHY